MFNTMRRRDCPVLVQKGCSTLMQVRRRPVLPQGDLPGPLSEARFGSADDPALGPEAPTTHILVVRHVDRFSGGYRRLGGRVADRRCR